MPVPSSGPLSLGQIRQELQTGNYAAGPYTANATALDVAENGGYVAINTCSINKPSGGNPAAMSEWYGYDQDAVCLNSYYALSDGGDPTQQNMLYNDNISYPTAGGTTRPSPRAQMSISFWMKIAGEATQGYLYGLYATNDSIYIGWSTSEDPNAPGTYLNFLFFGFQSSVGLLTSQVNVSDGNNKPISGVGDSETWSQSNAGNVDATKYALITVTINNDNIGEDTYLQWYWNNDKLICPWTSSGAYNISYTYGDSLATPNWTGATMYVGGSTPSELSSGCQLDGFAVYLTAELTSGEVDSLYNSGAVATLAAYQAISSALFYYNFELPDDSLGEDTGGTYGFNLDRFNNPTRIQDPAQ